MHRKPITKNIFLIGMPGAGKSTIGKILSENLFLPFYDADIYFCLLYTSPSPRDA